MRSTRRFHPRLCHFPSDSTGLESQEASGLSSAFAVWQNTVALIYQARLLRNGSCATH